MSPQSMRRGPVCASAFLARSSPARPIAHTVALSLPLAAIFRTATMRECRRSRLWSAHDH